MTANHILYSLPLTKNVMGPHSFIVDRNLEIKQYFICSRPLVYLRLTFSFMKQNLDS